MSCFPCEICVNGRLYDVDGTALVDLNDNPVNAEPSDANRLHNLNGDLFLVTHFDYD